MNISLDYDDTFTRDPDVWLEFINLMKAHGHTVICVTMRHSSEGAEVVRDLAEHVEIYFTGRKAKREYMYSKGISIDVWVDDSPQWVLMDAG